MLSRRFVSSLSLVFGLLLFNCNMVDAQNYYHQPYNSQVPMWQQMGTINPYYRPPNHYQIWRTYSNYAPARCLSPIAPPVVSSHWQLGSLNDSTYGFGIVPGNAVPIEGSVIESPILQNDLAGQEIIGATEMESIDPAGEDARVDEAEMLNDEMVVEDESLIDDQDSPSDIQLIDDSVNMANEIASRDAEIESMQQQMAELRNQMNRKLSEADESLKVQRENARIEMKQIEKELDKRNREVRNMQEKLVEMRRSIESKLQSSKDEINDERAKAQNKKLVEEAISKAKKESAWEIAKLRKEAESAKAEMRTAKKKADSDRKKLLDRLRGVESQLKKAKEKEAEDSDKKSKKNPKAAKPKKNVARKKMSLADLAEKKRLARLKVEAQDKIDNQSKKASEDKNEKLDDADAEQKQIDRAVSKIKRRFEAKIERAKSEKNSKEIIKKLKNEMAIQIEKMEERIRQRFKNRR